jgi:hypothetical protein
MIYLLAILPFIFIFFFQVDLLLSYLNSPTNNININIQKQMKISSSFFICSNAYDGGKNFTLNKELTFTDIKGCKDAMLSMGYVDNYKIYNFLDSYCKLFFPDDNVYLKIESIKANFGKKNDIETIVSEEVKFKAEKFCNQNFDVSQSPCKTFYIPGLFVDSNGVIKDRDDIYKFTICYKQ